MIDLSDETKAVIGPLNLPPFKFNGKSIFISQKMDHFTLYIDVSGTLGFAVILCSNWFVSHWQEIMKNKHIDMKELYLIVLAIEFLDEDM